MSNVTPLRKTLTETIKVEFSFTIDFQDKSINMHEEVTPERMAAFLVLLKEEWKDEWGQCPVLSTAKLEEIPGEDEPA
jgi:hypothetical protein